jgi:dihydroorotase
MSQKYRKPLLIKGGRIIDPARGMDEIGNLIISEGKILWLGKEEEEILRIPCDVIAAQGLIVCPGFIDLHCHLRQPGFEEKETIATGTRAAAKGGFTTICCMPNTNPPLDNRVTIEHVRETAEKEGVVRVLPIGCISKGRKGRELSPMRELAEADVIGFSDDGDPVLSSRLMKEALEQSRILKIPVIDHCEHTVLSRNGVINEGEISSRLGLPGIPVIAEEIMVARDLELAQITEGWLHIAHVTTRGSVDLIADAKEKGVRVTAEVTPHHLTMTEEKVLDCGSNAKVNPPLRTEKDIQALIRGLKNNVIDIIATDHAPHTEVEKAQDITMAPFGISGFETALGSLMSLVHNGELTINKLISCLSSEPGKIIGEKYGKIGTLATASSADITIVDPDREWVVDTDTFVSKGKNTPLVGSMLKGKVMTTISRGEIVYKDETIKIETGGI